jgi:hypothetical protein
MHCAEHADVSAVGIGTATKKAIAIPCVVIPFQRIRLDVLELVKITITLERNLPLCMSDPTLDAKGARNWQGI